MEIRKTQTKTGLIVSLVGLAAMIAGFFLPWFYNTKITVNGSTTVSTFGATLVVLISLAAVASAVLAILTYSAEGKKRTIYCWVRVLCAVIALYALMGVRKLMVSGQDNLPVTLLSGSWVVIAGIVLQLFSAAKDIFSGQSRGKKWSTIDLVLVVMTAAIYAAALLTLSFIKLAPGTWLRPANALQATFGILFGIPGCIGIALGNLLSDLTQGTAPHVMVLGTLTNFLAAFIPYLFVSNARLATRRSIVEFICWGSILGGLIVASSIFINVMFGLTPKAVALAFFPTTFLNQLLPSLLLGIPLTKLLYPFVIRSGLYRGRESARDTEPKKAAEEPQGEQK